MPKITLGITGLHEILGRDYGIEEPYWGASLLLLVIAFVSYTIVSLSEFKVSFKSRGRLERDDKCQEKKDSNEAQHLRKSR